VHGIKKVSKTKSESDGWNCMVHGYVFCEKRTHMLYCHDNGIIKYKESTKHCIHGIAMLLPATSTDFAL